MDQETGVTDGASPAPEVQSTDAAPGSVIPDQVKADRPVENLSAEFNRKFGKLQQGLEQLYAVVAQQQTRHYGQPQAPAKGEVTDEDLWSLAQQGDRNAFDEYMDRKAQRRVNQSMTAQARVTQTQNQINALMQKFPMFRDPSNALTQTAQQFLALYGGSTSDPDAVLKAMLSAVAERDDVVAEHRSQTSRASEQQRRSATQVAQSGQTGASHRNAPAARNTKKLSPEEIALGHRMGTKDPQGALDRLYERQKAGKSSVSPMLKAVLESEEGA